MRLSGVRVGLCCRTDLDRRRHRDGLPYTAANGGRAVLARSERVYAFGPSEGPGIVRAAGRRRLRGDATLGFGEPRRTLGASTTGENEDATGEACLAAVREGPR